MTDYQRQQSKIELEGLAHRVMLLLVQHQRRSSRGSLEDGLVWTCGAIAVHLGCEDVDGIRDALQWLRANGYVEARGIEFVKTDVGEDRFLEEIKDTRIKVSQQEFKREALTGTDARGKQSQIKWAALPGNESRCYGDSDFVKLCHYVGEIRAIAKDFGQSPERTRDMLVTGEIHVCSGVDGESPHWGRFHAHNGENGQRWQAKCILCRRKARKS